MKITKSLLGLMAIPFIAGSAFAACPNGTTATTAIDGVETCVLSGTYTSNLSLTSDKYWVLSGGVFIGGDNVDSATLSIEAGTKIMGQSGADALIINRGSKILAEGTAQDPIVFTTAQSQNRTRGMWGGLIINGNAPINSCIDTTGICEAAGEGDTGLYGGNDAADSSGILKYVVVEWAGFEFTPENELNGIAFQGVGSGTTVEYIQVHMNQDDGVEFFGGTVNAKYVYLTGNRDDSLDWTSGWTGRVQYVMIKQYDDEGNHGIEADNLKSPMDATPRSNPQISNMTIVATDGAAAAGGNAVKLRRGTGAKIYNSILLGGKDGSFNIDDAETFNFGASFDGSSFTVGGLVMQNSIIFNEVADEFAVSEDDVWPMSDWFSAQPGNMIVDPLLENGIPAVNSPAIGAGGPVLDPFFDIVDYIGAMEPANDWSAGWTTDARS